MRVMSAGEGYRYLLKSIAAADAGRPLSVSLADYYTLAGTPPGRWLGSGLSEVGLEAGEVVTEEQLRRLLGHGQDPVTGEPLGQAFRQYPKRDGKPRRRAVAGYDLTFSVPKSVSLLWALADPDVQAAVLAAHHAAVGDVLRLLEEQIAATRVGAQGPDGAVAQVDVTGVLAAAFDHFDSRSGDAQLHTHVVVSNKVRTVLDGRWRSLDGRPVHAAVVALSEHYRAVLADRLSRDLGVVWVQRDRGADRNRGWEIAGVPEQLLTAFSSRSAAINATKDQLIADYQATHGRAPSATAVLKLRQQATLATRPDKTVTSLEQLQHGWRARAATILEQDPREWARGLLDRSPALVGPGGLDEGLVEWLGRRVVEVVGERRATWRRWNLHAEASRQTMGLRFTSTEPRQAIEQVVAAAEARSLRLTPPDAAVTPEPFVRADGSSRFRPAHAVVFTSHDLLEAETRLLELADTRSAPALRTDPPAEAAERPLGVDQATAVEAVGRSQLVVDLLVGPAGAGKTTALRALRKWWEAEYGPGSVIGLAPSAAAAEVLGAELAITTDTLAKWLHEHHAGRARLKAGQLVILDEASLAGTRSLTQIASHAHDVGAKLLLVGDPAQLGAVDAGGALALLADRRLDAPQLTEVHRFHHEWERDATPKLRDGDPTAIDAYQQHGRIHEGDEEQIVEAAYEAWKADRDAGHDALLIAPSRDLVTALNRRAQHDRVQAGELDDTAGAVQLRDGTRGLQGDVIVTRRNARSLAVAGRWVRNGDRWHVDAVHPDGSLTVHRPEQPKQRLRLPAEYVAEHVELGYALTAHRSQGATVDTAHAVITAGMTRETLYVAMTRGRQANTAHVVTTDTELEAHHQPGRPRDGGAVLREIVARAGTQRSAHARLEGEQTRWGTIAQLASEYDTIAAAAQRDRWTTLIRRSGLAPANQAAVLASSTFDQLGATLRRAEAHGIDVDQLVHRVAVSPLDTGDPARVLDSRIRALLQRHGSRPRAERHIAGVIPPALGPMDPVLRQALDERHRLIEQRADAVTKQALDEGAPWMRALGPLPTDPWHRRDWLQHVRLVAAYRDRHGIHSDDPLGAVPVTRAHDEDAVTARVATTAARQLSEHRGQHPQRRPTLDRGLGR